MAYLPNATFDDNADHGTVQQMKQTDQPVVLAGKEREMCRTLVCAGEADADASSATTPRGNLGNIRVVRST